MFPEKGGIIFNLVALSIIVVSSIYANCHESNEIITLKN